jgi:hypothetical protein
MAVCKKLIYSNDGLFSEMLSRNLYECDSVCFALLDALRKSRKEEAVYWAYELQLSCEYELLDKTMVRAWLLYLGPPNIQWLDAWFNNYAEKLALVAGFCVLYPVKKPRVASMLKTFYIAGRGFSDKQDMGRIEDAIQKNNPFAAYLWIGPGYEKSPTAIVDFISAFVDYSELFDSLRKAMCVVGNLNIKILLAAAAVQLLCLSSYPESLCIDENDRDIVNKLVCGWDLVVGIKRRIYPILDSMLPLGIGRVTQGEGLNIGWREIMTQRGSVFWKKQFERITDNCETLETVVTELFPDDIPDEWGLVAKNVSHPVKAGKYKIHIKPSYRMKQVWGFAPVIRSSWDNRLQALFKASCCPDR